MLSQIFVCHESYLFLVFIHYSLMYQIIQATYGDEHSQSTVEKKMPKRVKKRRKVQTDDGVCFLIIHFLFLFQALNISFCLSSVVLKEVIL